MARTTCGLPVLLDSFGVMSAWIAWGFVIVVFLTSLLGTPLVMWLYKRRVLGFMSVAGGEKPQALRSALLRPAPQPPVAAKLLLTAADERAAQLKRVLLAACGLYSVAAGALLTLAPESPIMHADSLAAVPTGSALALLLLADIVFVGALCQPMVLIGIAHPQFKRRFWTRFAPAMVVSLALRVGAVLEDGSGAGWGAAVVMAPLVGLFVLLFYFAIARRHARQVGPVLNLMLGTLFGGLLLAGVASMVLFHCLGEAALGFFAVLAFPLLLGGSFWGAWRMAKLAARLYEAKFFSDAQVQIVSWLAMLTVFVVIGIVSIERPENGAWVVALAGVTLASLLVYLLGLRRMRPWAQPQALLMLRVFAQDERGEVLLDQTAFRWRFIGPIHMIGGPDLAQQTLDPQELLLFLRGRAREQFVATPTQLADRLATLDEAPDPDARYRVNELFCFDDIWQQGVAALLSRSQAVLLDLRGFTAHRRGTAYEIELLAGRNALARTVCLLDEATDLAAVEAAAGGSLGSAKVLTTAQGLDSRTLLEALAEAASRSRAGK
jgi:hypothetical protein